MAGEQVQTGVGLIRPSSLSTLPDCGRRFAARHLRDLVATAGYRLRAGMPRHIGAAVGTAVHAGVAYTLETKRATGELGNATEAEQRTEAALVSDLAEGAMWDDTTPGINIAKLQAARMTRSYRRHLAPHVTPLMVEARLVADVGDGWHVSGQADTMAGDPENGLRDLKTGTRQRQHSVQYGAYGIILAAHGYPLRSITEDYLARVRRDAEQPAPLSIQVPLQPAIAEAWDTIDAIKLASAEFERRLADPGGRDPAGAFRANPMSSLCGARWCPAFATDFCRLTQK